MHEAGKSSPPKVHIQNARSFTCTKATRKQNIPQALFDCHTKSAWTLCYSFDLIAKPWIYLLEFRRPRPQPVAF
jgi:hypothetical protein